MLHVEIRREPFNQNCSFFIYSYDERRGFITFYSFSDGKVICQEMKMDFGQDMSSAKPAFILSELLTRDLIQAFLDLGKKEHLKPSNESKVEGLYEATVKHLEDMRKIAFEKPVIITEVAK